MRTHRFACFLFVALTACSGNPKSLTDAGNAALGSGDYKAALADFEGALDKLGSKALEKRADDPDARLYLKAAIGRCQALAHVDPKKATQEFVALAKARPQDVKESDFSLIASELLRTNTNESRMQAIDLMVSGNQMFPESTKLKAIGDAVLASATKANDPESIKRVNSMGYGGGGK